MRRRVPARLVAVLLPLLLAAAATAPARQPERWAVLVGVNDYLNFATDEPGGDLLGAENDARAMRDVLAGRYRFAPDNMLMLLSLDATREAIEGALTEWLPARVRAGDMVVFFFAGHGSLSIDDDGDEADGLDETICPTDVLKTSAVNDIRDDELRRWLEDLPSDDVIVILDSCHSGTATRLVTGMRPRTLARARPPGGVNTRSIGGSGAGPAMMDGGRIIEIAAAAPDQSAMDATFTADDGDWINGGAFTTHLVRKLWQAPPSASYRDLFVNTVAALKGERFAQDPQLSGPINRGIFQPAAAPAPMPASPAPTPVSVPAAAPAVTPAVTQAGTPATGVAPIATAVAAPDRFVVLGVTGSAVLVQGGLNRGLVQGTLLRSAAGGTVRLDDVGATTSRASLTSGTVAADEVLQLAGVALPAPRLHVGVAGLPAGLRAALSTALAAQPDIVLTEGAAPVDLYVERGEAGAVRVLGRDGVERWTAPATPAAVTETIAPLLHNELAIGRLAQLENPATAYQVSITLAGGKDRFRIGDEIHFAVQTAQAGYLTLVDLGADGSLTVLYPNPWMELGRLDAGARIVVPGGGSAPTFTVSEPRGTGVVRAFITPAPLELGMRQGELLALADGGALAARVRAELAAMSGTAATWATALVVYVVE